MKYIVVSYYTINTPYEQEIIRLKESLDAFNIPYDIRGIKTLGSWVKNCAYKPQFVQQMLLMHPDKDVLFLDADAVVKQPLQLFDVLDADIGVHYFHGHELLSNTVYFRNVERVRQIVDLWIQQQDDVTWDQKVLQNVIAKHRRRLGIKLVDIGQEHAFIFDKGRGKPVIQQNQASRRFKKIVNEN